MPIAPVIDAGTRTESLHKSSTEPAAEPYNQLQMQLGSDIEIRDGLLAENTLLREKPRLGFERTETTVHQASIRLNYLNGNRVSSTVVFEGRPVSLMAQQQIGQDPTFPTAVAPPPPSIAIG